MSKSARQYKSDLDALDAEIDQLRRKRGALWLDYCDAAYREAQWSCDQERAVRQKRGQWVRAAWARQTPEERSERDARRVETRRRNYEAKRTARHAAMLAAGQGRAAL